MAKQQHIVSPKFSSRYEELMDALSKPVSSYTLVYEPHLVLETAGRRNRNNVPKPQSASKNILTNVKTLTRTGMLDGVAVRYINKTKQIVLGGIIKGSCYLCGCDSCNYSKTINAYEFEHHAGCKTCHPNNHIHFENGKSMHMAVQELKNTPEDLLYDAVQTITGCRIDENAFSTWKGMT